MARIRSTMWGWGCRVVLAIASVVAMRRSGVVFMDAAGAIEWTAPSSVRMRAGTPVVGSTTRGIHLSAKLDRPRRPATDLHAVAGATGRRSGVSAKNEEGDAKAKGRDAFKAWGKPTEDLLTDKTNTIHGDNQAVVNLARGRRAWDLLSFVLKTPMLVTLWIPGQGLLIVDHRRTRKDGFWIHVNKRVQEVLKLKGKYTPETGRVFKRSSDSSWVSTRRSYAYVEFQIVRLAKDVWRIRIQRQENVPTRFGTGFLKPVVDNPLAARVKADAQKRKAKTNVDPTAPAKRGRPSAEDLANRERAARVRERTKPVVTSVKGSRAEAVTKKVAEATASAPKGKGASPRQRGVSPKQLGTSPRQLGRSPRQRGVSPRQLGAEQGKNGQGPREPRGSRS